MLSPKEVQAKLEECFMTIMEVGIRCETPELFKTQTIEMAQKIGRVIDAVDPSPSTGVILLALLTHMLAIMAAGVEIPSEFTKLVNSLYKVTKANEN